MSRDVWLTVLISAMLAVLGLLPCTFALWFAPGWANGWSHLPMTVAWPAGMALMAFAFLMTLAVVVGAFVCLAAHRGESERKPSRAFFRAWLIVAAGLALVPTIEVFEYCHSGAQITWPNGYPNRNSD